jgi:hypothetical protein
LADGRADGEVGSLKLVTAPVDAQAMRNTARLMDHRSKKPDTKSSVSGLASGRRDWIRTNDPHHVKVVL